MNANKHESIHSSPKTIHAHSRLLLLRSRQHGRRSQPKPLKTEPERSGDRRANSFNISSQSLKTENFSPP